MTREELMVVNRALEDIGLENIKNITLIKEGATNGDVIRALFPNAEFEESTTLVFMYTQDSNVSLIDKDLWNAPYRRESEDKKC